MKNSIWLVGFRPFFLLAMVSGIFFPLIWAGFYLNLLSLDVLPFSANVWHAHEMLYGFGWAILGGFLLTASKNWTNTRGLHGSWLVLLTLFWMLDRLIFFLPAKLSPFLILFENLFIVSITSFLVFTLIKNRSQDSFRDNIYFILSLPFFIVAKNLLLSPEYFQSGVFLSIGLFRLAFAIMFERTLTFFMKKAFGVQILRNKILDHAIKTFLFISAFQSFLPYPLAGTALLIACLLLFARFIFWYPTKALSNFGTALSYVSYLGLIVHLLLEALREWNFSIGVGALSIHVFTFITMGFAITNMLIRICQGHTGRQIQFVSSDRWAIVMLTLGAVFRLAATQINSQYYSVWIGLSAVFWATCFALLGWRLIPFIIRPRIDDRVH